MSNTYTTPATETRGSYRPDYTQEDCMKFTEKDQAVLDRLAQAKTPVSTSTDANATSAS